MKLKAKNTICELIQCFQWQWDELHLKAWSWLKGGPPQGYVQFDMECDLMQYENKIETIMGIHL
jgi:hypothetical protein